MNLSKDLFYELLSGFGEFPKTAQASPQVLLDLFEKAKAAFEEAVYVAMENYWPSGFGRWISKFRIVASSM